MNRRRPAYLPGSRGLIRFFLLAVSATVVANALGDLPKPDKNECIVILHGLARSKHSMRKMAAYCRTQGYVTLNIDYPSTQKPVDPLTDDVASYLDNHQAEAFDKLHFVTHSMGGIITRNYIKKYNPENLGRVVMLSPPNSGSELVDKMKDWWLFQKINGPAGQQMGTDPDSVPNTLGKAAFPLGVIAGTRSFNPLFSKWIAGEDDGKVSVKSAKGAGFTDFLSVDAIHTFIMNDKTVIRQTLTFIETGQFAVK